MIRESIKEICKDINRIVLFLECAEQTYFHQTGKDFNWIKTLGYNPQKVVLTTKDQKEYTVDAKLLFIPFYLNESHFFINLEKGAVYIPFDSVLSISFSNDIISSTDDLSKIGYPIQLIEDVEKDYKDMLKGVEACYE